MFLNLNIKDLRFSTTRVQIKELVCFPENAELLITFTYHQYQPPITK